MKHEYRKGYEHAFEAKETVKAFLSQPPIDGRNVVEAWATEKDGHHFVHIILEGNMDPDEVRQATGFEQVG